ncbi:MAG TPA: HAD family hydrolase [Bacillota bacterium]|nr:HAD family hydrolase [Bacillota bacterium]
MIVFDLDDTLYPEPTFVRSGFAAVDEWCRSELGLEGFYETACRVYQTGVRGRIFNQALEQLGTVANEVLIGEMVAVYRGHQPRIALYNDARWVLNRFQTQYRLGLITDGDWKTQQNKVDALQIASFFDVLVLTDFYGRNCWKPAEFPYRKVMTALECQGTECVYVGDNPHKDFITAKLLGWRTVRVRREGAEYAALQFDEQYEAEVAITSLWDLPEFIEGLI